MPDVARVGLFPPGNLLDRPGISFRQLIEPVMPLGNQGNQILIGRCGFALRCADNQLCLDTAAGIVRLNRLEPARGSP